MFSETPCIYSNTLQCVIVVFLYHYLNFCHQVAFTIAPKVLTPKFESHKICKDFSPNNKDDYFLRIMKIQILLLRLAPGMSVDSKCNKKFDIGIKNLR